MSISSLYNTIAGPTSPISALYREHGDGVGSGDSRIANANNQATANYWSNPANDAALLASDKTIAGAFGIPLNQLSPQAISAYEQQVAARSGGFMDQTFMNKIVPMLAIAGLTAGAGSSIGGALAGTAGTAGTAATSGALGASIGTGGALTGVGSALVGAGTGALGGGLSATMSGGNIGKGILTGGALGAIGGGLKPFVQGATGLTGATGNIVNSGITGAGTGAVRGALNGQGALQGALSGAQSGATSAAGSAVTGSIFNSGNTVSPQLTQTSNPSTPNVSVDPSYFSTQGIQPIGMDTGYGSYTPTGDPNTASYNNYGNNPGTDTSLAALMGGLDPNYQASNQYLNSGAPMSGAPGGAGGAVAGAAGSATSSLLSRLLGGGGTGNGSAGNGGLLGGLAGLFGGSNSGLLASLLGMGASGIGGSLQSSAAKGAAGQFANQTHFNPYNVNTNGGSTTFDGSSATSSLSPGQQQNSNALNGLTQSSAAGLQAGPQAASQGYFNNLQAQDRDANNKFYSSNLDNQMANGVLSSTAGQYQSQAALGAINNKTAQNQVMANNFGQNQQQQQLQQLTAGLNGSNQINQNQLAQTALGGQLGSAASGANSQAYSPSLAANSGSNIGNLLATMGNTQNAGSSNQNALLQYLLQGHG